MTNNVELIKGTPCTLVTPSRKISNVAYVKHKKGTYFFADYAKKAYFIGESDLICYEVCGEDVELINGKRRTGIISGKEGIVFQQIKGPKRTVEKSSSAHLELLNALKTMERGL